MNTLLDKRNELKNQLSIINNEIRLFNDGFQYRVIIHSYGSHQRSNHNNFISAMDEVKEFTGDNGIAHLFTNNPNIKDVNCYYGNAYYIENIEEVNAWDHPENAVSIRKIYQQD